MNLATIALCVNSLVLQALPLEWKSDIQLGVIMSALIQVESGWNPNAVSHKGAVGLTQMTAIAWKDLQQATIPLPPKCRPAASFSPQALQEPELSIFYGSCYLKLLKERYGTWAEAIIAYNGGHRQVMRWRRGLRIAPETASYLQKIWYNIEVCLTLSEVLNHESK